MRIEYHPSLEGELRAVRDFYNERSPGLGDHFVVEFERKVLEIASMPERWIVVRGGVRRALIKRFPYLIFFRVLDDSKVRITVVRHAKRHPSFGMERK